MSAPTSDLLTAIMPTRNINLTGHFDRFVERQISSGDSFVMLPTTSMMEHKRTLPNGSILKFFTPV